MLSTNNRPAFDTLFHRQLSFIDFDRNVTVCSVNTELTLADVGVIVKARANLGNYAFVPHTAKLTENKKGVTWIIIPSHQGWVAVSDEAKMSWSASYHTRLMELGDVDFDDLQTLVVCAITCGVPLQRLMEYLVRSDVEPRHVYTEIIEIMREAINLIGGTRLKRELYRTH
jgi:hypothetical protein